MNAFEEERQMNAFEEERRMMELVQQADFVVVELTLYTNTHPDDEEALQQWREAIKKAAQVRRQYENRIWTLIARIRSD